MTLKTRKPVPRDRRPAIKNTSTVTLSRLVREVVATLTIGAMVATMLWSSVFGMSGNFGPGPEITINERLAAGGGNGR
jgi:hypothetical protein